MPGITSLLATSIVRVDEPARARIVAVVPTAAMRSPRIDSEPSSEGSAANVGGNNVDRRFLAAFQTSSSKSTPLKTVRQHSPVSLFRCFTRVHRKPPCTTNLLPLRYHRNAQSDGRIGTPDWQSKGCPIARGRLGESRRACASSLVPELFARNHMVAYSSTSLAAAPRRDPSRVFWKLRDGVTGC
jgi:hypothetical protein